MVQPASSCLALILAIALSPVAAADAAADSLAQFGLVVVDTDREPDAGTIPPRLVVLVHGLNDPHWVWDRLVTALGEQDRHVACFEYSSRVGIAESAERLAAALREARRHGCRHVSIVAHSMGGLVARDVLTRDTAYAGRGIGDGTLPAIDRLITLGTPNHGSELARLHPITVAGEEVVRQAREGALRPQFSADLDPAARDLVPGSAFLVDLNARPLPSHTRITVVAARILPADSDCLDDTMSRLGGIARRLRLDDMRRRVHGYLRDSMTGFADRLGDGLVTVDSARLAGVNDFVVVDANHLTMIHDGGQRGVEPPAIPIVLDRLGR